ncbi:MAG: matrixin family metalloprotease [Candidatus Peribacteraceae bacterium]
MVKHIVSWTLTLLFLTVAGLFVYRQLPCRKPIVYSVGRVDARFGMGQEKFALAVEMAEALWEGATGRGLFHRVGTGGMVIRAVYDNRQAARERLEEIGLRLDQGKDAYTTLHAQYEEKRAAYLRLQTAYDAQEATYQRERTDYDSDLQSVQARGPSEEDYNRLEGKRQSVNRLADRINAQQGALRDAVDEVNALVGMLRRVAEQENMSIEEYQDVGESIGEEYEAGAYERVWGTQSITVYAFSKQDELIRLLAHEMGHALGIGHLSEPDSVMYRLNQTGPIALSPADIVAVEKQCAVAPRLWESVKALFSRK